VKEVKCVKCVKKVTQEGLRVRKLMGAGFEMALVDGIGVVDGGKLRQACAQAGPASATTMLL